MESIAPQTPIEPQQQTSALFADHSAFNYGLNVILWRSPVRLIGKHYWRLTIYREGTMPGNTLLTGYEWARREKTVMGIVFPQSRWKRDVEWPRYNHNDGMYGGMPRGLLRLYHDCEVSRILDSLAADESAG